MKDDWWIFCLGFLFGGLAFGVPIQILSVHDATRDTTIQFQREAVKARAARWIADENGAPTFAWSVCTALGTKQ